MGRARTLDFDLAISDHFPAPSLEQWRETAEQSLGGRDVGSLISTTRDGIPVRPLYSVADLPEPLPTADLPPGGWQACQLPFHSDPVVAGKRSSAAARLGVDVSWVILHRCLRSGRTNAPRQGVLLDGTAAVRGLMESFPEGGPRLILDGGGASLPLASAFAAAGATEAPFRALVAIYHDPLGALAADGALPLDLDRSLSLLADLAAFTARTAPDLPTVAVSTVAYADAGATAVQELAFLLATGIEYLRALTSAGLELATASRQLRFVVTVGGDLFEEQAKLRAARRLWRRAMEACGAPDLARNMVLHAVTSLRTLTVRDRWTNALRAAFGAFAAVTGGADALTILPFDIAAGPPSDEALRLSALTHAILREEAALGRVADPAAGSFYCERLADELARAAWTELQTLEAAGGMARALHEGPVGERLQATAARRREDIARRAKRITGVSSFPDLAEPSPPKTESPGEPSARRPSGEGAAGKELARLAAAVPGDGAVSDAARLAFAAGASLTEVTAALAGDRAPATIRPLPQGRDSEPFEALRDGADWFERHHGHRPLAFLAAMGPVAEHRSAAAQAANLLAAGGFHVLPQPGFRSPEEAVEAFAASSSRVAVICAARSRLDELVPPLARALKARGARRVLVAARPDELRPSWPAAGVDAVLGEGCDLPALLRELLELAGVPR